MSTAMAEPRYLTRAEAAAHLRTSLAKVDQAIHSGRLRAKKVGRNYLIRLADLDAYFDSLDDA
jgi:excisionase family DNA binding protein